MKTFEYFFTRTATGELDIEDLGNCYIEAFNDEGLAFYLLIETNMGWTKTCEYGPISVDFKELPNNVSCVFNRFEYDEKKLNTTVKEFLNAPRRNITQAMEIEREAFFENCRSILDYVEDRTNF